mmetsp:Transcript_50687/g.151668  ORF Transcript_50687/g.151668 Transcript_50687/m.151668 type:complete len:333 (+) Transcript_50687:139-1137(+)
MEPRWPGRGRPWWARSAWQRVHDRRAQRLQPVSKQMLRLRVCLRAAGRGAPGRERRAMEPVLLRRVLHCLLGLLNCPVLGQHRACGRQLRHVWWHRGAERRGLAAGGRRPSTKLLVHRLPYPGLRSHGAERARDRQLRLLASLQALGRPGVPWCWAARLAAGEPCGKRGRRPAETSLVLHAAQQEALAADSPFSRVISLCPGILAGVAHRVAHERFESRRLAPEDRLRPRPLQRPRYSCQRRGWHLRGRQLHFRLRGCGVCGRLVGERRGRFVPGVAADVCQHLQGIGRSGLQRGREGVPRELQLLQAEARSGRERAAAGHAAPRLGLQQPQ